MTTQADYRWDVAISLLSQDEAYAAELKAELERHVRGRVFLYSRAQEQISQDGQLVEYFIRVFRHEARFAIILHRERWGTSRYTAVEQDALRTRYLAEGAHRILVISLDGTYPTTWYPEDLFRPSAEEFSQAQIAAIVIARLEQAGAAIGPENPVSKAVRLRQERARKEHLASRLAAHGAQVLEQEATALFEQLRELASQISEPGDVMTFEARDRRCCLNYRGCSIVWQWHRQYQNSLDGAELAMSILNARTSLTGRRIGEPRILLQARFDVAHPDEKLWGWSLYRVEPKRPMPGFLSTSELAHWALNELVESAASGEA